MARIFYNKNEFEVLAYVSLATNKLLQKNPNTNSFGLYKEDIDILTEENVLKFSIYSVKRLKDGLIFSIGDKVKTPASGSIITKIEFSDEDGGCLNLLFEDGTGDFLEDIEGFATDEEINAKIRNVSEMDNMLAGLMENYGKVDETGEGKVDDTGFNDQLKNLKNWMDGYKKPPEQ